MRTVCLLACYWSILAAQTGSVLTGRVGAMDGSVVAGATVEARNADTNFSRQTVTGPDGRYVLPGLPAGAWEIRASKANFKPTLRKGVDTTVGEVAVVDFTLELGDLEQEITVTGSAPAVNTQTSELSYLVAGEVIRELPLNGRNYTDLALLQPGVVAYPHRDGGSVVAHGLGMSVNGQDPRSNVYLLDGTPQNDFTNGPAGSAAGTALGTETIREFRVETNAYSAEFGRNSGGQINALTKSGTNSLHGSLYHFHRNDNFDARNFFDPERQPEFQRNQYGVTVGGPLRRDRTFFFLGYEGLRERLGRTISSVVPDENARRGLLPDPQQPGRLLEIGVDEAVRPYLEAYPVPNGRNLGGGLAIHAFEFRQGIRQDFGQGRLDHNFGGAGQWFLRYTIDDASQRLPTGMPQFPRSFLSRNQFVTSEHILAISPATLNTLRVGFSRTNIGQDVEANLARPLEAFVPGRALVGNIDIGGVERFGPQTSVNVKLVQNVFGVEDGLNLVRGRHSWKIGGMAERYQDNMVNPTFALGIHTFANLQAFLQNRPLRFLGLAPTGALDRYWRFTLLAAYLQDSISITPRLTLNLGLRYETTSMPIDIYGRDSAIIRLSDAAPTPGRLFQGPPRRNLMPRFGFAWDPGGGGRTSFRGGYGVYFNTNSQQNLIVTVTNPPATPRLIIANPTFPVPPFERGVGNSIRPIQWNYKSPNVHMWNLNLQRQVWGGTVLTLGYAGSRGIHLLRSSDVNTPQPERRDDGTLFFPLGQRRPNPNFSTIEMKTSDGNSWYNAMIFEVRRRWANGLSAQSSYTFARSIDTTQASTFFSDATNGTTSAMPEFPGFQYNKGLSDFHAKHNWVLNFLWDLPFASSRQGWRRQLFDGWQLAGIATMRSGNPLTLFLQRNRSRSQWSPSLGPGLGFDRPSMAPGRTHQDAVLGGPDRYFDPSAFILPEAGTLGNLGRGALIGPNLRSLDASLMKKFRLPGLGERAGLQFRAEAFNLFNRANFGNPALLAFAGERDGEQPLSSLGVIRSTVTSARQIQFALRLSF